MRHTSLASLSLLCVGLLFAFAGNAEAQTEGTGTVTLIPYWSESVPLPDGTMLMRDHSRGVVLADDPASVAFHMSAQDCRGTSIMSADGELLKGHGYCDSVDGDGHVYWIWYENTPGVNTWGFMDGTGKYEGMEGGGTVEPTVLPDGRVVITWKGSWTTK